jgi:UDP-glucose 4-epimerase
MDVLVTGGCGFIGSHVVDALCQRGDRVTVIDDLSTGLRGNLNPEARLVEASILDRKALREALAGVQAILHTAAWARVVRSVEDPVGTHAVNVTGTLEVLQAARDLGIAKFVYSSSSSVVGEQDTHVITEDMTPRPVSPYALQKLMGEQYCTLFARLASMRVTSLRYFNVYGERQLTEGAYALVIGKFLRQRSEGVPLSVYGEGDQTRAYTHVSDIVRANLLALDNDELPKGDNTILNIGTSQETSVLAVARLIDAEVTHIRPNPRGHLEEFRKVADNSRARQLLGWEPIVDFREGMSRLLG